MNIAFNHQNALVTKTLALVLKGAGCLSSHTIATVRRSSGPNILPLVYCQHRTRNIFYQKGFNKEVGKKSILFEIAFVNLFLKVFCPRPTHTYKSCIHISNKCLKETATTHPRGTGAHKAHNHKNSKTSQLRNSASLFLTVSFRKDIFEVSKHLKTPRGKLDFQWFLPHKNLNQH